MSKTKYRATPAARALIKQNKLDISLIKGTGPKGRIQKDDVLYFDKEKIVKISPLARKISGIEGVDISAIVGTGINGKIMKDDIISYINLNEKDVNYENTYEETSDIKDEQISNQEIEEIPMSMMRRTVAKRMSESYFTAPTFIANIDVDMTETKALREKLLESIMEETGYKLTVTDIVSLAAVKSLLKHPYINSSLSENQDKIILHKYVNLSIAVGLESGLLTPVVKNAEKMGLKELVTSLKILTKKAVNMKLESDDLQGSTFTISNLGMFGITSFTPIINQPNSAILGVSAIVDKPVVLNGEIKIKPIMNISVTVDHRIIDGLEAAKFLNTLKKYIENPISMLI